VRRSCYAEKIKFISDGGDSGSKKYKRGYGGVWRKSSQAVGFVLVRFGRNLVSVAVKMFSDLIYFMKLFYKFCTFNATCKYDAEMDCITGQHKKGSFLTTLTGHTTLAIKIKDIGLKV
jgi:hypothetical protein